ncbi:MAG: Holliday junction resolvase RuvX [Chlorobi bacterium]|nr:Holliday junction resolvase RuvX [Chlorobiota bacterium]
MGRVLAIDYGLKRCGIAVSDPTRTIAQPLKTIETSNLLDFLKDYIPSSGVSELVLGYPLNLDGSPTELTPIVEQLAKDLEKEFGLPVHLMDERFTSRWAERQLIGNSLRKKKQWTDALAAANILETFLLKQKQIQ